MSNFFERGESDGEQMKLITKYPESMEPPIISQGIISGVVRGNLDSTNPPIYSSRALLYKLPQSINFYDEQFFDISKLSKYCFYSDAPDFSDIPTVIESELRDVVNSALTDFVGNDLLNPDQEGRRIIIR